jgi:hypothetical protein
VPESEVRAEAVGRGSIEAVAKEGEHATA